jgi:predicted transcriptional regulator
MSRPNRNGHRINTAIRFPDDLHAQLLQAASDRDLSMNWLVVKAVEDYLSRLLPADEIKLTR